MNSLQLELPAHGHPLTKVEVTDSMGTVNHTMDQSHELVVIPIPSDRNAGEVGVKAWGCDRHGNPKTDPYVLKEVEKPGHPDKKRHSGTRDHKKGHLSESAPESSPHDAAGRKEAGREGSKKA